jgi:hypothetical protein
MRMISAVAPRCNTRGATAPSHPGKRLQFVFKDIADPKGASVSEFKPLDLQVRKNLAILVIK